jgi:hypothetical protein
MSNNCNISAFVRSAFVVVSLLFLSSRSSAEIVVDDFYNIGSQSFPVQAEYPAFAFLGAPETVDGVFGGSRTMSAVFGVSGPFDPPPSDSSLSIDLDPALGALHVEAGLDAIIDLNIGWGASWFSPFENADASMHPKLLIEYSSTVKLDLTISLANQSRADFLSTPQTVAGSKKQLLLPARENGRSIIDVHEITDDYNDPFSPFIPGVDLTSLDSISFKLRTEQLGSEFSLYRVAFVPEPASGAMLVGMAAFFLSWRWPCRLA